MKQKMKHLLLISVLLLSLFQFLQFTKAEDWSYYKEITVSNFSASYQVKITVHYNSGTDGTNEVHLNSHCQTDFDDIQFRDQSTVLKHWKEEYTASDQATVWVKLPSSSQTIYIYYGNSEATDSSDPDNVFTHFDDCENTDPTSYWTENDSSYGDVEYTTSESKHGFKSMKCTQTSTTQSYVIKRTISETDFILEFYMKQGAGNNWTYTYLMEYPTGNMLAKWEDTGDIEYYSNAQWNDTGYDYTITWVLHRFTCFGGDTIEWELNDTTIASDCKNVTWSTIDLLRIFSGNYLRPSDYCYFDDIRIRKYASTPPSFTFGSEQSTNSPPNTPTNSLPTNGATDQSLNPVLQWSEYSDPESDPQQAYEVRVDNNSDFSSPEWTRTGSTGNSTTVNTTNGDFGNDCSGQTELDEDDTYYWDVRVQDDQNNWSDRSTATNFTTDIFSPTCTLISPSNTSTNQAVNPTLEWSYNDHNSDPQQNCKVEIDNNSDFSNPEFTTGGAGGGAVTSMVANTSNGYFQNDCSGQDYLLENTLFYWHVMVKDDTGRWSEWSSGWTFTTGTLPAAPTGCTATYISDSQIDLEWNDNASNETGYKVYRSVNLGEWSLLKTVGEDSTGTTDTDVASDNCYEYKVRAYNDAGFSLTYCEMSQVCTSPAAPTSCTAELSESTITLTWTDNSNITDLHQIERSVDSGEWTYLDEDSDGSYQDTAGEWTTVKYRVRAKAGSRYSSYVESNVLSTNSAPTASFTFSGAGGTEITFDARGSSDPDNDPMTYSWDLGNGDTAEGDYITYDYKAHGTWTVTLTVDDGELNDQTQKEVTIYGQSSGGSSSGGTSPAETQKQLFETIGKTAKETVENAKENDVTPFIVIIVIIILIAAYKKR